VEPLYEWEKEERGYIFETRLEKATEMKEAGNVHFKASEWDLALRRYRRALYHGHIDEMQMFDLGDKHKADVHAVLVPCKLNLAFCIIRMTELGEALDAGALDQAEDGVNEVLKLQPDNAKAHYRKGQIKLLQTDLPKAKESLDAAEKLAGGGGGVREAKQKLRELMKQERQREREMYTGKLQTSSLHQAQEAVLARRTAQWAAITAFLKVIGFPFVWPTKMLLMTARAAVDVVRAWVVGVDTAR